MVSRDRALAMSVIASTADPILVPAQGGGRAAAKASRWVCQARRSTSPLPSRRSRISASGSAVAQPVGGSVLPGGSSRMTSQRISASMVSQRTQHCVVRRCVRPVRCGCQTDRQRPPQHPHQGRAGVVVGLGRPGQQLVDDQPEHARDRDLERAWVPTTAHHRIDISVPENVMPQGLDRLRVEPRVVRIDPGPRPTPAAGVPFFAPAVPLGEPFAVPLGEPFAEPFDRSWTLWFISGSCARGEWLSWPKSRRTPPGPK